MSNHPTISLPAFLTPGSPLRSPHVFKSSFLGPHMTPSSSSNPTSFLRPSYFSIRPTRRDMFLCLLTLSFSYLLFSPPLTSDPIPRSRPTAPTRGYRIPGWSTIFTSESGCPPIPVSRETTFSESAKMVGPNISVEVNEFQYVGDGKPWDEGEEEAEDDELEGMATILSGHQPGWTLMERLYAFNGSFYVIT